MNCGKPIEYTCWTLSAIIIVIIGFLICSEIKSMTASPRGGAARHEPAKPTHARHPHNSSARHASARKSRVTTSGSEKPRNEMYDNTGTFMLATEAEACVDASRDSDTSHFFNDSGEDLESYKKTNMKEALAKTNHRADILAKSDTGSPHAAPARTKGSTTVPWMQLMNCNEKKRNFSNTEIAFNGSSHLDAIRGNSN